MRSRLSTPAVLLYLLSAILLFNLVARADDDTDADDEYEEHARVLRVSLLKGEVSLKRAGDEEWTRAQLNTPLVEGDLLATGRDSRLEIQANARNFIRVGPDSALKVVTLRDEGIALSLSEGTATLRLARFDKDKEYFELDAPGTTVAAEKTGLYRVDANRGGVNVTVRGDGRARIYSQTSGFVLRDNRTARLLYDQSTEGDSTEGDWEVGAAAQPDEWDSWNDERERFLASRLRYEGRERYYDADVYGAEELDLYGEWVNTNDYGYVWRPHTTVVNNYNDWAPYRYGHWDWCPPYGWTWIPDEEWGWAPYHYGRWVQVNNQWCWAPHGYGYNYRRARWRPALVAFVTIDFGSERRVCWYPLTHGQRDPRGRWSTRRDDHFDPRRPGDGGRRHHINPALLRAVSSCPERDFGNWRLRARRADDNLAQRALASEPVRGRLPFAHGDGSRFGSRTGGGANGNRTRGADGRDVLVINRPSPGTPPAPWRERPTGAAARTPGVPLDNELRRTRIFNNREPRIFNNRGPRIPFPSAAGGDNTQGGSQGVDSNTGAVERPGVRRRTPADPNDGNGGNTGSGGNDDDNNGRNAPWRGRRSRPAPRDGTNPVVPNLNDEPEPRRRNREDGEDPRTRRTNPVRPHVEQPPVEPGGEERPTDNNSKPAPVYRPQPRIRPRDEGERAQPPPARREEPRREEPPARREEPRREEPPSYRPEPRQPRESQPPRNDPPPRREPPPQRQEPPQQEAPRQEPRHEQPRQEPPRQEPPRQEAPRQEAPRQESPRQESPRHDSPQRERTQRDAPPARRRR
jgi:hypothetical protein